MNESTQALTGDEAAAYAMRQIEPDVVAAFPITPQTEIVMKYSQYKADGKVATRMIPVESEHSAMSACVGSASAGARTMTATAANGLALMHEILYIAASTRLPIVMSVVNRALSAPINIHSDHSDTMGSRDSGWIQIYCENPQEVYTTLITAVRIAEHPDIRLPVMVCQDGFITSHTMEPVTVVSDDKVKSIIGSYEPEFSLLDTDNPITIGPLDLQDYYFEHKRQQSEAMSKAVGILPEIFEQAESELGFSQEMVESYRMDDADTAFVVNSSSAGTAKYVVDTLREKGEKVGVIRPRVFRPFPAEDVGKALFGVPRAVVMDRSETFSAHGGPLYHEVRSALYGKSGGGGGSEEQGLPIIHPCIFGLGGRELYPSMIEDLFYRVKESPEEREVEYLGVR